MLSESVPSITGFTPRTLQLSVMVFIDIYMVQLQIKTDLKVKKTIKKKSKHSKNREIYFYAEHCGTLCLSSNASMSGRRATLNFCTALQTVPYKKVGCPKTKPAFPP